MRGIDLSHWNGATGESILKDGNVELDFCICKHSEGLTMMDDHYDKYRALAEYRGILHGGYHFYVGNRLTAEYRDHIVDCFFDMYSHGAAMCFIDWERELDVANGRFICSVIDAVKKEFRRTPGIYASYSTFMKRGLAYDVNDSLATYCKTSGIPIWCARYKYKDYRPDISYGAIKTSALQTAVDGVPVDVNQITSTCVYDGRNIDLDYNVAWNYGMA